MNLPSDQKDRVVLSKYKSTKNAKPIYIIDLRSPALKMESFLPPEDLAQIFKKNIETVFALAGFDQSEEDVYFLGYSRGVLSALNLLTKQIDRKIHHRGILQNLERKD